MDSVCVIREKLTLDLGVDKEGYDIAKDPDCWWTVTNCTWPKDEDLLFPDISSCYYDTIAISIEGGPNCSHNAFYDSMRNTSIYATLFYVGSNVVNWPLQAQRGIVDGHELCVNSWSQRYMTTLPNHQVFAELYYTMKSIKIAVGVTPTCWRPPFGDVDDRVRAIASGLGLRTVMWTLDPNDENIQPDGNMPTEKIRQDYDAILNTTHQRVQCPIVRVHELDEYTMGEFQDAMERNKLCGGLGQSGDCSELVNSVSFSNAVVYPYPENFSYPVWFNPCSEYRLPNGSDIKVDPNASVNVIPLRDNLRYGFGLSNQQGSFSGCYSSAGPYGHQDNFTNRANRIEGSQPSDVKLTTPNTLLTIALGAAVLLLAIIPI